MFNTQAVSKPQNSSEIQEMDLSELQISAPDISEQQKTNFQKQLNSFIPAFSVMASPAEYLLNVQKNSSEILRVSKLVLATLPTAVDCEDFQERYIDSVIKAFSLFKLDQSHADRQEGPAKIIETLRSISRSDKSTDSEDLIEVFEDHNIETPYSLKDKKCDKLIDKILDLYGHENTGRYQGEKRKLKFSSWQSEYVPQEVKELVKYRNTAASADLDAEQARPALLRAREAMYEQALIKANDKLRRYFARSPEITAQGVLDCWSDKQGDDRMPKLFAELSAEVQKSESLAKQAGQCRSLYADIPAFMNELSVLLDERRTVTRAIEIKQEARVTFERVKAFLESPQTFEKRVSSDTEFCKYIGQAASKYGSEYEKNCFCAEAVGFSPVLKGALHEFAVSEIALMKESLRRKPEDAVDTAVAMLPRIVVMLHHLGGGSSDMDGIFEQPNFPAWIVGWYEHLQTTYSGSVKYTPDMPVELLAFGRAQGHRLPLVPALKLGGSSMRRGIDLQTAQLLEPAPDALL